MTLRYVLDQHELVADFVARMIPHLRRGFERAYKAIGIVNEDDELIAGLVYHFWPEAQIAEISGAALPGHYWLTRMTLRVMHEYPFEQCLCQMVIMRIRFDDERLKRQLAMIGYEFVRLPRIFGPDQDGIHCYLTEEAWMDNKILKRLRRGSDLQQISKAA